MHFHWTNNCFVWTRSDLQDLKVKAILTLMGSILVLMPHDKATPRYLHGTSINKKTKNMKPQMKKEQTNELMERQNHEESDDAETAPGFLEGDIAIPEVN